jgi:hypothetical protein
MLKNKQQLLLMQHPQFFHVLTVGLNSNLFASRLIIIVRYSIIYCLHDIQPICNAMPFLCGISQVCIIHTYRKSKSICVSTLPCGRKSHQICLQTVASDDIVVSCVYIFPIEINAYKLTSKRCRYYPSRAPASEWV